MVANGDNEQLAVQAGRLGFTLKGTATIIVIALLGALGIIIFFVWNGFAAIDVKHNDMLDEMKIQSYILAECLRSENTCPNLVPPPGLAGRIYRKP